MPICGKITGLYVLKTWRKEKQKENKNLFSCLHLRFADGSGVLICMVAGIHTWEPFYWFYFWFELKDSIFSWNGTYFWWTLWGDPLGIVMSVLLAQSYV